MWSYLASVRMYPFHKNLPEDRTHAKPILRPVTVGSVLTRFGCRVMVKMNMVMVAEQLLLSHHSLLGSTGVYNKSYWRALLLWKLTLHG